MKLALVNFIYTCQVAKSVFQFQEYVLLLSCQENRQTPAACFRLQHICRDHLSIPENIKRFNSKSTLFIDV